MTDGMHTARLNGIKSRYEPGPPTRSVIRNPMLTYADIRDLITEVARLREQVETLQAELEICRGERFGTDPAAWAKSLPVTEEGP